MFWCGQPDTLPMFAIKGRDLEPNNRTNTEMLGNEHTPSMASQHRLGHCAPEWLQAVAGDAQQPCGDNLEYDNDYAVLQSLLIPKLQVQYGSFTSEQTRGGAFWGLASQAVLAVAWSLV
jgi:hypothetical protein